MKVRIDDVILRHEAMFQHAKTCNSCIGFNEYILPDGCDPPTSRLAFDWQDDTRLLMVDQGISYPGPHKVFQEFVQNGVFSGSSSEAVTAFLTTIKGAYDTAPAENIPPRANPPQPPTAPPPSRLDGIFDRSQINVEGPKKRKFDEEALLADALSRTVGQKKALTGLYHGVSTHVRKKKARKPYSAAMAGPSGVGKSSSAEAMHELLKKHTGDDWGYIFVNAAQMASDHTVMTSSGRPPAMSGITTNHCSPR
jgi:hypothetical protein